MKTKYAVGDRVIAAPSDAPRPWQRIEYAVEIFEVNGSIVPYRVGSFPWSDSWWIAENNIKRCAPPQSDCGYEEYQAIMAAQEIMRG